MDLIVLVVPLALVAVVVVVVVFVGRRWPFWGIYSLIFLPLVALGALIWFFTQPALIEPVGLDPAILPQLLASTAGAVVGVIGAGVISIMERRWTDEQRKADLDWNLRASLRERLSHYPYNKDSCSDAQLLEIKAILEHAKNEVQRAISNHVLSSDSTYKEYIEDMQTNYG